MRCMSPERSSSWNGLGAGLVLAAACSSNSLPTSTLGDVHALPKADGGTRSAQVSTADSAPTDDAPASDAPADGTSAEVGGNPSATDATPTDALSGDAASSDAQPQPGLDGAPPPASRCNPLHVWAPTPRASLVPQAAFGRFGGIGIDELTIAWTSTTGTIYIADRTARGAAFGPPTTIDTTSTPVATDRVALDPTGMLLFAVSADRTRFIAFDRAGVGAAWTPSTTLPFAQVNAMASAEQGGQFSEPVLGADGSSFFYLLASSTTLPALYESKWDALQGAWSTGNALANPALASASTTAPTYATGASSDGRTLFFHDGAAVQERAAWRDSATSPFVQFVDVSGIFEAAPNFQCNTLYFQGTNTGGTGVFIAQ
jgi:hypothetical protein